MNMNLENPTWIFIGLVALATVVDGIVRWIVALAALLALVFVAVGVVRDARADAEATDEPDSELARARRAYVDGEIPLTEFEERAGLILDEDARDLRERVEQVNGVGPETSAALAEEFRTTKALARADPDEVTAVHGVGDSTAAAVVHRVRGGKA